MGGTYNFPEISVNTEENIAEVEQKSLLTNCTTKLLRYYGVTLHFLDFHQKKILKIPPPLLLNPSPFYTFARVSKTYPVTPHSGACTYIRS